MCFDLYEHFVLFRRKEILEKERGQVKIFRLPIITFLIIAFVIGNAILYFWDTDMYGIMLEEPAYLTLFAYFIGTPLGFVIFEMAFLLTESFNIGLRGEKRIDLLLLTIGSALEVTGALVLASYMGDLLMDDRLQTERFVPVNLDMLPTFITILAVGVVGYIILEYIPMKKMVPMVAIIAMSAMYLGDIILYALTMQLQKGYEAEPSVFIQYIYVLPACWIMITARVIIEKIREWKVVVANRPVLDQEGIGTALEEALNTPLSWPIIAILMMIPLFAILVLILGAFGQPSDAIARAFTETIGWTFSK